MNKRIWLVCHANNILHISWTKRELLDYLDNLPNDEFIVYEVTDLHTFDRDTMHKLLTLVNEPSL